ncbi:MAG: sigma 54-interacting transcriptional regulator [Treponemataceae bacterium]|nr:sigma 54-interacting transcriptional regulator [Treponemataceae bacterium]
MLEQNDKKNTVVVLISSRQDIIRFCSIVLRGSFSFHVVSNRECFIPPGAQFASADNIIFLMDCSLFSGSADLYDFLSLYPHMTRNAIFIAPFGMHDAMLGTARSFDADIIPVPCESAFFMRRLAQSPAGIPAQEHRASRTGSAAEELRRFIGRSSAANRIRQNINAIATTDIPVLFQGESGTGKTLLAKIIHNLSRRAAKEFVGINMATIPEHIAESELFGTVNGAFTGAVRRSGFFTKADGGTLFMDEIAELLPNVQAKLLHVIDTGIFNRLGSVVEQRADIRLICATNSNMEQLIRQGRFRSDLYYRISDITIEIPPLRERREDIRDIAESYIEQNTRGERRLAAETLEFLENHNWPGNVRQLQKCLRLTCSIKTKRTIYPQDLIL